MSRAVIFANGELSDPDAARRAIRTDDVLIACDGGLRHIFNLELTPHILIGDLDSAPSELVQIARGRGVEILTYEARKDKTDLELALDIANDRGLQDVLLFGALGGRLDHALTNILLPSHASRRGGNIRAIESGYDLAWFDDRIDINGRAGDLVTMLSLTDHATGIETTGLEYQLQNGSIDRGSSVGVSNVMTSARASIALKQGYLLLIHTHQSNHPGTD